MNLNETNCNQKSNSHIGDGTLSFPAIEQDAAAFQTTLSASCDFAFQYALRSPTDLQTHPSYARHGIRQGATSLDPGAPPPLSQVNPILITTSNIILKGHEIWKFALRSDIQTVHCLECDLDDDHALLWILENSLKNQQLNDFQRIALALDLEPLFAGRARENQRSGGRFKGSTELPEAGAIDTRHEIALAAGVCDANVSKVKRILEGDNRGDLDLLHSGQVSIHQAHLWLRAPNMRQEYFVNRMARETRRGIRRLVVRHDVSALTGASTPNPQRIGARLAAMTGEESSRIRVFEMAAPRPFICVSRDILRTIASQGELPYGDA